MRPLRVTSYRSQSITSSPWTIVFAVSVGAFLDIARPSRRATSSALQGMKQSSTSCCFASMPFIATVGRITTTGTPASVAAWTMPEGPASPVPSPQIIAPSALAASSSLLVSVVNFTRSTDVSSAVRPAARRSDSASPNPIRAIELTRWHPFSVACPNELRGSALFFTCVRACVFCFDIRVVFSGEAA